MQPDAPGNEIARRLQEALDQLHRDVQRIEVWAGALSGFAQPVPDYTPSQKFQLPPASPDAAKREKS